MFREGGLDRLLRTIKKIIPKPAFELLAPVYHWGLAWAGAAVYGFPSRSLRVVGVTGTKGKSTTVFLLAKIFEKAGQPVAMLGSLGYKIREKEWPNTLKMTMPGRFKIQKFLSQAKKAGCRYVFMEVTSEGIKQKRHLGIHFDAAVLTNLHKEHIESHGSFENYLAAKMKLFKKTRHAHILNEDEPLAEPFKSLPSEKKIFYGARDWNRLGLISGLKGAFNQYNILAAAAVAENYGIPAETIRQATAEVRCVPGRMEYIEAGQPFKVVIDYAHTPESLAMVYETLKKELPRGGKLICVLGAAGGGRDKWKRPEFGKLAAYYGDEVILTNEDPYDEIPEKIIDEIFSGISEYQISNIKYQKNSNGQVPSLKFKKILDRKEAIRTALTLAQRGDILVITGKGSETSMALSGGRKIPWSDKQTVLELLK